MTLIGTARRITEGFVSGTAALCILCILCMFASAGPLPDFNYYQVDFGAPAASAQEAFTGLSPRSDAVISWNACGQELELLKNLDDQDQDVGPAVIGKIAWLNRHGEEPCEVTVRYLKERISLDIGNRDFQATYGVDCGTILQSATPTNYGTPPAPAFNLKFSIGPACLKAQINAVLMRRSQLRSPGTDGAPCRVVGVVHGDYDMSVISYVRAYYLDRKGSGAFYKVKATREHVFGQLLTISEDLNDESYGFFQCGGASDKQTGSPQERADAAHWYDDGFWDDLGDLLDWLLKYLLAVIILVIPLSTAMALLAGNAAAGVYMPIISALVVSSGIVGVANQFRIPETENHLLMINSSRYLTNQIIIDELSDKDDKERYQKYQEEIREWLLQRLQRIAREDFIEYNAKPYNRLSIASILNLYDFAPDNEVRLAAKIVLEYASARFAAASNQGRRFVPFRRLMEQIRFERYGPSSEGLKPRRLFDLDQGADHQVAAMLLFAGQTQHLPSFPSDPQAPLGPASHYASIQSAAAMIWEATSDFVPSGVTLDLAINKSVAYDQRIHHAGFEIYSSGVGYMITAGGILTDFAYQAVLGPLEFAVGVPFHLKLHNEDRGAAVPTTLMSASGTTKMRIGDFIRFEGPFGELPHSERDKDFASDEACISNSAVAGDPRCNRNFSSDHNICVRKGFACGINLKVPGEIEDDTINCFKSPPGLPNSPWRFIDSAACPAYSGAPRFFVVLYRTRCPAGNSTCLGGEWWGFFEAIDVARDRSFDDFITMTMARNPPFSDTVQLPRPFESSEFFGIYHSWRDELIEFAADAHQQSKKYNGIFRVRPIGGGASDLEADINDWPLADGDAIRADGKGRITIMSPGRVPGPNVITKVEIDFTDWEHPKYVELP